MFPYHTACGDVTPSQIHPGTPPPVEAVPDGEGVDEVYPLLFIFRISQVLLAFCRGCNLHQRLALAGKSQRSLFSWRLEVGHVPLVGILTTNLGG
jgi:hypothetical protein